MDALSEDFFQQRRKDLQARLKPKRYTHSLGVSQTAEWMAEIYGYDTAKARIAGLLHDWDKVYDDDAIRARAYDLGVDVSAEVIATMPQILHGFTAARALEQQFPELPMDVLDAIRFHTTGKVDMGGLEKIIYVADVIEPGRDFSGVDALREAVGCESLDDVYFLTYQAGLENLIARSSTIYPGSVEIWNSLVQARKNR